MSKQVSQDQIANPLWRACVPAEIEDPFKDLITALGLIGPRSSAEQLQSFLSELQNKSPDLAVSSFFGQMLIPSCLGQEQPLPSSPACRNSPVASAPENSEKNTREMMALIDEKIPFIASVCSTFLAKPDPTNQNGKCFTNDQHGMAVIGYRCSAVGDVQFLVQNSWGETWCPKNKELECNPGQGSFWVNDSILQKHTMNITSVLSPSELTVIKRKIKIPDTFMDDFHEALQYKPHEK